MGTRTIERWILFARLSFCMNAAMAVGKLLIGAYTMSLFLCIHALYNGGMAMARIVAVRGYRAGKRPPDAAHPYGYGRREYHCYFQVGLILAITSILFIVYSMGLFVNGSTAHYSQVVSIAIAAITFTEIGLAVYGLVVTGRVKETAVSAIKMTNLASSLISLTLTQTAILSFTHDGEVAFYNGIGGIAFGTVSALIGVGMMLHMSRVLAGKGRLDKKLSKAARCSGVDLQIEPVRYEDYGPKAKHLYANVGGGASGEGYRQFKEELKRAHNIVLYDQSAVS